MFNLFFLSTPFCPPPPVVSTVLTVFHPGSFCSHPRRIRWVTWQLSTGVVLMSHAVQCNLRYLWCWHPSLVPSSTECSPTQKRFNFHYSGTALVTTQGNVRIRDSYAPMRCGLRIWSKWIWSKYYPLGLRYPVIQNFTRFPVMQILKKSLPYPIFRIFCRKSGCF